MEQIQRLRGLIKEEVRKILKEENSKKKQIAYDLAEEMNLYSAYHGALKTFDGSFNDIEVTVEYHGSGDKLSVFGSPKNTMPKDENTVQLVFKSPSKVEASLRSGEKLEDFKYTSAKILKNKLETLVKNQK